MGELVILVPVLRRPQNVAPLLASIRETHPARVLFIVDPDDSEELAAIDAESAEHMLYPGTYPQKINAGIRHTSENLIFLGADDLRFRQGWFSAALNKLDPHGIVGVNDLIPRDREHTTHFLVTREYTRRGTIDGKPGVLSEAYRHERCDDELIATAKHRELYAYAEDSHVEHLHPLNGGAEMDATYAKGLESSRKDRRTYLKRRELWT